MSDDGQVYAGERLRLARDLRGWTQAELARRLEVTSAAVSLFEQGDTEPNAQMTTRLATALGVPPPFLTLPLVTTHDGFFRSLRRTPVSQRRRARAIAQVAHDLLLATDSTLLPKVDVPSIPQVGLKAPRQNLEEAAQEVRRAWGIPPGPLDSVVARLEVHGILVIRLPLDSASVDAFSLPYPDRPLVVLSADKGDRARSRFDAAHELGHLVMHGNQIWGVKEVESQAHVFAAAFLMPEDEIGPDLPSSPDWPRLFELKQRWQVSLAALLMRAKTLGVMSDSQYLTAIKAASARGWRRVEPVPLGEPEQPSMLQSALEIQGQQTYKEYLPQDVVGMVARATAST